MRVRSIAAPGCGIDQGRSLVTCAERGVAQTTGWSQVTWAEGTDTDQEVVTGHSNRGVWHRLGGYCSLEQRGVPQTKGWLLITEAEGTGTAQLVATGHFSRVEWDRPGNVHWSLERGVWHKPGVVTGHLSIGEWSLVTWGEGCGTDQGVDIGHWSRGLWHRPAGGHRSLSLTRGEWHSVLATPNMSWKKYKIFLHKIYLLPIGQTDNWWIIS